MGYRVGVDIGGTFADFCLFDEATNDILTLKVLTTPARPGSEIVEGLRIAEEKLGVPSRNVESFVHGTTVGVNTVIQEKGAKLALLTTQNFEDVLAMARLRLPDTYNLLSHRPPPLIPRDMIFPVRERMSAFGTEIQPLDESSVRHAIASACAKGADGVVVSFLNAYRNPAHELRTRDIIAKTAPHLFVFTGTEVWPVIREYERTATAVINGYVHPRVSGYIASLTSALRSRDVPAEPLITTSSGGVMKAELGKRSCVNMLMSGTASGVIGAAFIAEQAGIGNLLTLDIGGTSADVAVIADGKPQFGSNEKVGQHTIHIPAIAVSSIGEGGGSIAWVDETGVLHVGPESAGSDPGPACFGNGGTRPTVTDAFCVCGLIGQGRLAYGSIQLDRARAVAAVGELAEKLSRPLEETAQMIIDVAVSGMYLEISKLIARHGIDVRDFTLMAFGGAGPMLAPFLARELGISQVLVPTTPGVISALGSLVANVRSDFISSFYNPLTEQTLPEIVAVFDSLKERAVNWLRDAQRFEGPYSLFFGADMHYLGQSFEIDVPWDTADLSAGNIGELRRAFHRRHEQLYSFHVDGAEIHIVNLRLAIAAQAEKPALRRWKSGTGEVASDIKSAVFLTGAWREAVVIRRDELLAGQFVLGPAIVTQPDTTTCVPDGFRADVDPLGNIILSAARS